jgi:ABC-type transport system substrate-binding protein
LIVDAVGTPDQAKAADLYAQITRKLQTDVPQLPLIWLPNVIAVRNRVHGFTIASQNFMPLSSVWVDNP